MARIRNMLNTTAMDILYYTSPLYRTEVWFFPCLPPPPHTHFYLFMILSLFIDVLFSKVILTKRTFLLECLETEELQKNLLCSTHISLVLCFLFIDHRFSVFRTKPPIRHVLPTHSLLRSFQRKSLHHRSLTW